MGDRPPRIVADVAALRALPKLGAFVLYIVRETGSMYLLDRESEAADDGLGVIKPTWAGVGAGRFLALESGASFDEGVRAVNGLRIASASTHGQTLTIGDDVYEVTTRNDAAVGTPGHIAVDLHGGTTVKARGRLTFTGQPSDAETVTLNGKVYTFQTVLTNVDGHVFIGATAEDTIDNLVAAVMLGAGAGTKYATATTAHTTVTAAKSSTDKVLVSAIAGGTVGNAYTLAEAATNVAKDAATLGTDLLGVDPSAANTTDGLVAAINASGTEPISATKISNNEISLSADEPGVDTTACSETLTGTNNALTHTAMYGGRDAASRKVSKQTRVPKTQEVTLGSMHFWFPFTPTEVRVRVVVTATPGLAFAFDGSVTIAAGHVTIVDGGAAHLATTHNVEIEALE